MGHSMRKKVPIILLTLLATGVGVCWLIAGCATGKPALALSFSHYETNHGFVFGVVQITNAGTGAASYSSHSFGSDAPFYSVMTHSPTGWANVPLGWCGTETHPSVLGAGSRLTFSVLMRTNQSWKVGISYSEATFNDRVGSFTPRLWRRGFSSSGSAARPAYTVWSQPIDYRTE